MTPDTWIDYRYESRSSLRLSGVAPQLSLATSGGSTSSARQEHPSLFSGFVEQPAIVAQSLLLLARVARTRFYVPPNTLAMILRGADPVITVTPEGLRFESFSVCCGVYARLDVDASALDVANVTAGVTNVDVNPPLREALARLRPREPLRLTVGRDELRVHTLDREIVEESVPLPARWLRGLAETQMLLSGMSLRHELTGIAATQFIRALPRASTTKSTLWATATAHSLRLASRPAAGAVSVAGPERLRILEPLLRFATSLRAFGPEADPTSLALASAWVLDMPGARVTVGLSPEKSRGFSGEGSLLASLVNEADTASVDHVSALLNFQHRIDPVSLSTRTGLSQNHVDTVLATIASAGQLGFDLDTSAYFHRPLPMRDDLLSRIHPRLEDARRLVNEAQVSQASDGSYLVGSGETAYRVVIGESPTADRCSCLWYTKYHGTRGPCKHVLAARSSESSTFPPSTTS